VKKPWDEIEEFEDDMFQLVFYGPRDNYVSEVYGIGKDETLEEAALGVCRRFGWDRRSPGKPEKR